MKFLPKKPKTCYNIRMQKNATITCYDISSESEKLTYVDDFLKEIENALNNSKTVASRIRYLSDLKEEGESQFISSFSISKEGLFCAFLHMEKGSGVNIPESFMTAKEFDLADAEADSDSKITGHIKEATYFFMTNKYLVLKNSRGISKEAVSIYLNYLLENMSQKYKGKARSLFLKYHIRKNFDVTKIKSFALGDGYKINQKSLISTVSKAINLKSIFGAVDMDGLSIENVLSASIVFKIKRLPKNSENERIKIAQTIFDGFNTDNVKFMGKGGATLSVEEAKTTHEFSLNYPDGSRFPDKDMLKEEMVKFIAEVERESNS